MNASDHLLAPVLLPHYRHDPSGRRRSRPEWNDGVSIENGVETPPGLIANQFPIVASAGGVLGKQDVARTKREAAIARLELQGAAQAEDKLPGRIGMPSELRVCVGLVKRGRGDRDPAAECVAPHAGFKVDDYNQYGYDHTLYNFNSSQVQQNFQTFHGQIGIKNATSGEYGFSYDPHLDFSVFRDNRSANEINALISVPLEKQIDEHFAFKVNVAADLTNYKTDSIGSSVSNNIFYVTPVLSYHSENFSLNAGINPSWDNNAGGKFNLYPKIDLALKLTEPLSIIAGWNGYYQKNNYEYLAGINPYMQQPTTQYNSEVRDLYGGIKGSAGTHMTYLAKVSFLKYVDLPLFVNDSVTGRSFYTVEEYMLKNVQMHGELSFTAAEHFSLTAAANINNYYSIKTNLQPYYMPPWDLTAKLRWQPVKDVTFKTDLFTWGKPYYLTAAKNADKIGGAFDLNAGVEFSISKSVGLWLDCNNILNNQYQRWNQYQVYGFNILGGVVFSFGQRR